MGCPVNNVKSMEESLRFRRQKLVIVLLASANSDSRAVDFIMRNFHVMDVISDNVDFYMPGYGINRYNHIGNTKNFDCISRAAKEMFPDFHTSEVDQRLCFLGRRCTMKIQTAPIVINSPRLGEIVFNVAEFTDFVMEFTRRIDGFHFLGGCQMVLLQPDEDGIPDYRHASVYDLDSIINTQSGPSLDAFIHRVFQLIRDSDRINDNYRRYNNLRRIFFGPRNRQSHINSIIKQIDALYYESTRTNEREARYDIVIKNIILDINNCLHWDITTENFYFISYSSRNIMLAKTLKKLLLCNNIHVWIAPDGIPQGREYPIVIPTALKLSKVFVLLLAPDSARSTWVKRELAIAIGNSCNTKIKVLLAEGMTINDVRQDNELCFLLDQIQIKYDYQEIIYSETLFKQFINE